MASAVFCELNGAGVTAIVDDDVMDLVMGVAAGHPEIEEIAAHLGSLAAS